MGEPASAFVEVNGARLNYEDSGNGETLVLIHAGIADSRMWEGQLAAFARCYRVIRYDMRGFGRSEMGEGPYIHHRDLHALLDALGVKRAHLVGCSMGGRTAIDFTLEYPARVRSLQRLACQLILNETNEHETVLQRLEAQGARSSRSWDAKKGGRADLWRLYADHQTLDQAAPRDWGDCAKTELRSSCQKGHGSGGSPAFPA